MIKKPILAEPEKGFSMIEVLASGMIIFFFLLGSLQAVVLATMLRVEAQAKADGVNYINQEIDAIKYQAFLLNRSDPYSSSNPYPDTNGNCASNNYGLALRQAIQSSDPNHPDPDYPATGDVVDLPTSMDTNYPITRTYTLNGNSLQINWRIDRDNNATNNNDIVAMTTEVLPDGALYCP
jgi:type II secretory pathway pseudopilin PulG